MYQNVINYDQFDFTNSTVIKPSVNKFDNDRKNDSVTRILVSSLDRDMVQFPKPNDYIFQLFEDLQDVTSVELDIADISPNPYNITTLNNMLVIALTDTNDEKTITVAPGIYNVMDVRELIEKRLNIEFPDVEFSLHYNDVQGHFVILCDVAFQIRPCRKSMAKVLGFALTSAYLSKPSGNPAFPFLIESEFCSLLEDDSPIVLHIEGMGSMNSINKAIHKAFFVIPKHGSQETRINTHYRIKKSFNPPLPKVNNLRIRFFNTMGEPYDFQNRDHLLEFVFSHQTNTRRYHSYVQ